MSSLIIKVTQNGTSREYLFGRPGPIVIGSDKHCDLWLDDPHLERKMLEVKVSGGNIFIKELGARSEIYLNSVILPFRQETRYHEGEIIALMNTNYQIQVHQVMETQEPPPFFDNDFKSKLNKMSGELQERGQELRKLVIQEEKKQLHLLELEEKCHQLTGERNRLELEVQNFDGVKENLVHGIREREKHIKDQEQREHHLKGHLEKLEQEENCLQENILAANRSLSALKDERDAKNREINQERLLLVKLQEEVSRLEFAFSELNREREEGQREIQEESARLQTLLLQSEAVLAESHKLEGGLRKLQNQRAELDHEVSLCQTTLAELGEARKSVEEKLLDLKSETIKEEAYFKELQEKIECHKEEEGKLSAARAGLHADIEAAESKLNQKKDQLNHFDFQCQDSMRKLTMANFELERVGHHLKELEGEEKAKSVKVLSIREEIQSLSKKAYDERKELDKAHEDKRCELDLKLKEMEKKIETKNLELQHVENDFKDLCKRHEGLEEDLRSLQRLKVDMESQVKSAESAKVLIIKEQELLKQESLRLGRDKSKTENELALLSAQLKELENRIRQRTDEARLDLESFKREERAKMLAEKEVLLSEVEAFKQKSLIEVDVSFRRQVEDLSELKTRAQHEADDILKEARKLEEQLTSEAMARLKSAANEAHIRENEAHQRIKDAQEYFKQKEMEADVIIQKSRLEARDHVRKTEVELLDELSKRKQKIKRFLSMKQEQGLLHLKNHEAQFLARMKRNEARGHEKLELLKRKELKKIARLREEELSRQNEIKEASLKEVSVEKERIRKQMHALKIQQEQELNETRKTVLEHINQTKFRQQSAWEEELRNSKAVFEQTKEARIRNGAQAVLNVMIGEFGFITDSDEAAKERIQETLKMAIDGQNAEAMKQMGQVLDINPELRKKVIPVMKKFALRFGVPAAIAVILLSDMGSLRTKLVDYSKKALKQEHSASDIFVDQQKVAWKEKYTFNPPTTPGYKASFTDNVLYTTDFEAVMDNEQFQNDWILKVHEFMVKELELSEDVAISYISSEGTLVKELASLKKEITPQFKEQGIAKLAALEVTHLGWLRDKITEPAKNQKFLEFRKSFYDQFYLEKFKVKRDVATENSPSN